MWRAAICGGFAFVALGCGPIGPGAVSRPAATGTSEPSSGSGSGKRYTDDNKPIYDDKGCANMSGEGGAKIQAGCRSGK